MKKVFIKRESTIPFTKEGYQKILEEKTKLLSERPDAVEHLARARQMGDLSENGYYKASRARLSFLDARIRRIERLVRLGRVVQSSGRDVVEIGSHVIITDGKNLHEYSIVGGYESDPSKKTISHHSPLGRALMGKKKNDIIEVHAPAGNKAYTIKEVT